MFVKEYSRLELYNLFTELYKSNFRFGTKFVVYNFKTKIMKTTFITITILLVSSVIYSQNTNVKEETKTTTTTVKNSEGDKKFVKTENVKEVQIVELKDEIPNTLNKETKDSPVTVTTTTKITNPDGTTRTVDIDRSSFYKSNGNKSFVFTGSIWDGGRLSFTYAGNWSA